MTQIVLLEPSIADVLKAIEAATDLPASKKTHWSCSLRQICIGIGRPPECIPGRWSGVNSAIQQLHHARVGCNPKTLANHRANARAALLWFAGVKNLPKRGAFLSPAWASLRTKIPGGAPTPSAFGADPVRLYIWIQPSCDWPLLRPLPRLRFVCGDSHPPGPTHLLERLADLKRCKVFSPAGSQCRAAYAESERMARGRSAGLGSCMQAEL